MEILCPHILKDPVWQRPSRPPNLFVGLGEQKIILRRITAALKLLEGKSYREVSKEIWISSATVSAIKKSLGTERYKSTWKIGSKKEPVQIIILSNR